MNIPDDFFYKKALNKLPDSLIKKIFELSGDDDNGRGLILCALDPSGDPMIYSVCSSRVIEMGLRKALENWLDERDNLETTFPLEEDMDDDTD